METIVVNNPAMDYFLSKFREKNTSTYECNCCVDNLSIFLAGEVSKHLETKTTNVATPLGEAICEVICEEVILVPVLRAGISMLGAFQRVLPQSKTGFVWAHRDHNASASIDTYKFPKTEEFGLRNRTVIILDTMLATAGTVNKCADLIEQYHPKQILCASILSTQTGIQNISDSIAHVVTACISDGLDENAYIYPGVGDSGDRLYG